MSRVLAPLAAALVLVSSLLWAADSLGVPDEVENQVKIDAKLLKMYNCEDIDGTIYNWKEVSLKRVTRTTIALSGVIEILQQIPDTPSYSLEIDAVNQPGDDNGARAPVAHIAWPDMCDQLKDDSSENMRRFQASFTDGKKFLCPIEPGEYTVEKLEIVMDDVKPVLRNGLMIFNVTHILDGKMIACQMFEFKVAIEEPV